MKMPVVFLLFGCVFALVAATSQKPADVAGAWTATVRMPGGTAAEQWTVQQKGTAVTGTVKMDQGTLPFSGTIEGAFFRVSVKDSAKEYKVRATVDGNTMDGSITLGVGESHVWSAKRAKK